MIITQIPTNSVLRQDGKITNAQHASATIMPLIVHFDLNKPASKYLVLTNLTILMVFDTIQCFQVI
jgi:hypothetical protein